MYIAGDDPERFLLFVREAEILSDSAQINCVITQFLDTVGRAEYAFYA